MLETIQCKVVIAVQIGTVFCFFSIPIPIRTLPNFGPYKSNQTSIEIRTNTIVSGISYSTVFDLS